MADAPLILLVDDDDDIRECVGLALEDEGYRVQEADGGDAALVCLRAERPDLLLLDYRMPGMNGPELLAVARAESLIDCPVVLLSAGQDPEQRKGPSAVDDSITKPFELDDLLDTVKRHLPSKAKAG